MVANVRTDHGKPRSGPRVPTGCILHSSYTHPTLILHSSYPLRMHFIAFWLSYMMYDLTPKACKAHRLTDECPPNTYTPRQPTHARMWRVKGGFTEPSYNLIILQPSYGVGWDLEPTADDGRRGSTPLQWTLAGLYIINHLHSQTGSPLVDGRDDVKTMCAALGQRARP